MINQGTYQQIPGVINKDNVRASVLFLVIKTVVFAVVIYELNWNACALATPGFAFVPSSDKTLRCGNKSKITEREQFQLHIIIGNTPSPNMCSQ